ncbi:MAG TPA: hypothetical protein VK151_10485 [Fluviicola sp.]|nr:hypothetical protein [Fluviicola sp.]
MRSSLEQFERVSDYVSGKLTESQRSLFELEMSNDPFLQEQVAFQKDMVRVVERRALRSEIGAVASSYAVGGMSLMSKLMLGAGGALVVGIVGYFTLFNTETSEKPKMAALTEQTTDQEKELPADSTANKEEVKFEPQLEPVSWNFFNRNTVDYMPPFYSVYANDMPTLDLSSGAEDNAGFVSLEEDSLIRELIPIVEQKRAYVGSWRTSPMSRAKVSKIPGLRKQVKSRKKAATVYVTDEEGNILNNAKMTYSYFGEQRTVLINGVYAFDLYSDIKTNVVIELENGDKALIENVDFKPRYGTYIEIDGYTTSKKVKQGIQLNEDGSIKID